MKIYEPQTITLTYSAACEAIAEAFNHSDWKRGTIAELSRQILERMGFKYE